MSAEPATDGPLVHDPRELDARAILVIAPHPDDETLGCGGLVTILAAAGRTIHTVFVTDGGASHPRSADWPRARLAAQREAEGAEALARLGVPPEQATFLRLPDAAMPAEGSAGRERAVATLAELAAKLRPDLVLLPWRRDPHCDHRDAWALATQALERASLAPDTLEYAIWLDEIGAPEDRPRAGEAERMVFGVGDAVARKRHAVAAHLSQTGDLIHDDPTAFRLTASTIDRLCGPEEAYWRPLR